MAGVKNRGSRQGLVDIFNALDADVFCLQETKLQAGQIELDLPGYEQYWNYAERKGYSGTAVFTRIKPLNVTYGMGIEAHDTEGRMITLEYETFYLINVYTPNSKDELARLPYRMEWEDDVRAYLKKLEQTKPVGLWVLKIDFFMCHIQITTKNNRFCLLKFFEIRSHIIFPFHSIWKSGIGIHSPGDIRFGSLSG